MSRTRTLDKVFVRIPPAVAPPPRWRKVSNRLKGTILSPVYWLMAHRYRMPGLSFHLDCTKLGLRLLLRRHAPMSLRWVLHMISSPVVLTRYFEFDFAWRHLPSQIHSYLDVSSPFMFPLLLLSRQPQLNAQLINPDKHDLQLTASLVEACGFDRRCSLHHCLIHDAPFADQTFGLITSISVVEHIPQNTPAVQKMWGLLRPGGKLLITVPCAATAYELHTNIDHYGLLGSDDEEFTFLEFVYDEQLLHDFIFCVTGLPEHFAIYGEKRANVLRNELIRRWSGHYWNYWREPVLMGCAFRPYDRLSDLPGEGVIGMEFVKR